MTDPVVRKMAFQFDASVSKVPFMWQPANPQFAIYCNAFTFIAVPFEKHIIGALRRAEDRLNSEAQHASAHRKHMLALIEQYPGLEQCYERGCGSTTVVPI